MKHFLILSALLFISSTSFAQLIEESPPTPEPRYEIVEDVPDPPRLNQSFTNGLHPFQKGDLYGLKDYETGEVLLEAKYSFLESDHPGIFSLRENSKWGIYSTVERRIVIPVENAFVMPYKRQLPSGEKCVFFEIIKSYDYPSKGILDNNYQVVVPATYDQVDYFPKFLRLRLGGKWGIHFYDPKNKNIPVVYDWVQVVQNDNFSVRQGEVYALFDTNGKEIFGDQNLVTEFYGRWEVKSKGHLLISDKNDKMGIFHMESNKIMLPQTYDAITDRFYNLYIVKKKNAWGIVNHNNKAIVPFKYEDISFLKPGNITDTFGKRATDQDKETLISVARKGKYGLINRSGEAITKVEYDEVEHLYGFYALKKNGKYAVVNNAGEAICKETFDAVGHFYKGRAAVFNDGKKSYLRSDGTISATLSKATEPMGYKTIDALYEAFVEALKSEDDEQLIAFSQAVAPDTHSIEFMKRVGLDYRGIPNSMGDHGVTVDALVAMYFAPFAAFRDRLKNGGQLESLKFAYYEHPVTGISYENLGTSFMVMGIENPGVLKAGDQEIRYKLGELINIDGYWKSFTKPRQF